MLLHYIAAVAKDAVWLCEILWGFLGMHATRVRSSKTLQTLLQRVQSPDPSDHVQVSSPFGASSLSLASVCRARWAICTRTRHAVFGLTTQSVLQDYGRERPLPHRPLDYALRSS